MSRTRVVLVRHAPTLENDTYVMIGHTNPHLHETGKTIAHALARALMSMPFAAIVTSPLLRAQETAQAIHQRQPDTMLLMDPRFMELHLGVVEGMSSFAAYGQYKIEFDTALNSETEDFAFPEGETWVAALRRTREGLKAICQSFPDKTVCVVTHGALLGLWRCWEQQLSLGHFRSLQPKHASISIIEGNGDSFDVLAWNETAH